MNLNANRIAGPVPSEWESLTVLDKTIHLEDNLLSGRLPSSLQLDLLASCGLQGNRFSCPLPTHAESACGAKCCESGNYTDPETTEGTCDQTCPADIDGLNQSHADCRVCPEACGGAFCPIGQFGQFSPAKQTASCISCPPGKYQADTSQIYCKDCPAGKYQADMAQAYCMDCAAGKHQKSSRQVLCAICPLDKFSGLQQAACDDCYDSTKGAKPFTASTGGHLQMLAWLQGLQWCALLGRVLLQQQMVLVQLARQGSSSLTAATVPVSSANAEHSALQRQQIVQQIALQAPTAIQH
jgi:hypothetical protein